MMQLYGTSMSGNCWKAAVILQLTGHAYDLHETDSNDGATRTPAFLAINPAGKVPALVLNDGEVLTESNAILLHFAEGTPWLPAPGMTRSRVHECFTRALLCSPVPVGVFSALLVASSPG